MSETNNRLFIGNVPKSWTEKEFRKVIEDVGPGVDTIELIKVKFELNNPSPPPPAVKVEVVSSHSTTFCYLLSITGSSSSFS